MLSISGRVGIQCKQRQQKKRIILSPLDIIPDAETNEKPRLQGNIWGKYHLQSKPYSDKKKKKKRIRKELAFFKYNEIASSGMRSDGE